MGGLGARTLYFPNLSRPHRHPMPTNPLATPTRTANSINEGPDDMTDEKFIRHVACSSCGGSDCNAEYESHYFCFSCETRTYKDNREKDTIVTEELQVHDKSLPNIDHAKVGPLVDRNITADTVRHFGVKVTLQNGTVAEHFYPYYNRDGALVAYKKRVVASKTFPTYGNIRASALFGQDKFTSGGKFLTLCEGEIDTLSAFQMNGSKFPCLGVKSSSSAYKDCKNEFEFIDSFDSIIIAFDADEPGQKAAIKVAELFPKKSKIVKLKEGKDINWYLQEHKEQEYTAAWWGAERYKPDDILGGADAMWNIINQPRAEAMFKYPWDKLNTVTYGIRTGEFVIVTAGSGMGKTQVLREISHACLKNTEYNIGLIYLEETAWETARGLLSMELNKPTHLPDTHVTEVEMLEANINTWGTDRVFTLNDSWRDNDVEYICDKIRFLSKGLDCKLIILDHISFMVSDQNGDERKMLDEIGHKLKALTVELDIALLAVCHSKRQSTKPLEEGGATSLSDLRGTAGLGQLANIVLGLERNGQHDDERERNTTLIRVLKNRFSGITGPTSRLHYDRFTGRLTEVDEQEGTE
jgi:twinkle protein